jgi:hypothetical protein
VSEVNPHGLAADEMRKLRTSIKKRMAKGAKAAAAPRKVA